MYKNLLSRIRTSEELNLIDSEVELLLTSLYEQGDKGFDSVISSRIRSWVSREIKNDLEKDNPDKESYLSTLKGRLEKYKVLKMTLAFEPTDISIDKFFYYIKKNIKGDVVIEFGFDPKLLGGASVSFDGKYFDLTLRKVFDDEFEKHEKDLIAEIYKRVSAPEVGNK